MVNITKADYEKKRHVFDLCRWINDQLTKMELSEDFDTIFFERKGANVKKLIEEAIPISCLGLYLSKPKQDVYITCLTGNQPYDAIFEVVGWNTYNIKVEVTTIETTKTAMRRQALSRYGTVWQEGPISRNKREISSHPEMVDVEEIFARWLDIAYDRFKKKLEKKYNQDTAILISLDTYRSIPMRLRSELVQKTENFILREKPDINSVHYCYLRNNVIDSIYPSKR